MPLFWLHTSLHSNLLLALPFANMNWVGFISFICMLVAIVLWPFNVVKIETICYAYASNITLQFMPIYVCTGPGGSPLMDYLLQRTYLRIHLHLLQIEVIRSWYVGPSIKKNLWHEFIFQGILINLLFQTSSWSLFHSTLARLFIFLATLFSLLYTRCCCNPYFWWL